MGCDIHLMTERLRTIKGKKQWVCIDKFKPNPYYGLDEYAKNEFEVNPIYRNRNYILFSMLANVRNYSDNKPISEPKGIPEDCSKYVKSEIDRWDSDGHSHSFFTLKELKEYLKSNPNQKFSGLMPLEEAKKVDAGEDPSFYCQWSSDESYVKREWERKNKSLDELIEKIEEKKRDEFWIFDNEEHPEYDHEIRIVFWFDN